MTAVIAFVPLYFICPYAAVIVKMPAASHVIVKAAAVEETSAPKST
jgi:hypothetical protein